MTRIIITATILVIAVVAVIMWTGAAWAAGQCGTASFYAHAHHGKTMANGKPFNMHAMTAAHKTLPFGTKVRVKSQVTGNAITVTITDRGPYIKGRIIDLSLGAATKLGMEQAGTARVCMEPL